jgi:hypothetical protein
MSPSLWEIGLSGYVRRKPLDLTPRRGHREELGGRNTASQCLGPCVVWTACVRHFLCIIITYTRTLFLPSTLGNDRSAKSRTNVAILFIVQYEYIQYV